MKHTLIPILLLLMLVWKPVLAQQNNRKIYIAKVGNTSVSKLSKRDKDEITFQAKSRISELAGLFEVLTTDSLAESVLTSVIQNSYLPNQNQIFFNDAIVIEDDINPKHTSSENTADLKVDRYLRDMSLFYSKSDVPTITFSRIIASSIQDGKDYPYVKIFFGSAFTGKYNQSDTLTYQPTQRVAELRADKIDGKWRTTITRLGFVRPGEGLTELSQPVLEQAGVPTQRIKGESFLYRSAESNPDSVTIKLDSRWLNILSSSTLSVPLGTYQRSKVDKTGQEYVGVALMNNDQQLTFRRIDGSTVLFNQIPSPIYITKLKHKYQLRGWLQVVVGVAALGASYAGYSSLQNSYNDYTSRVNATNGEYAIWQTLTQQPGGSTAVPMSFGQYSQPGIYAVYGGGAFGSALLINGIRSLMKAGRIKIPARR